MLQWSAMFLLALLLTLLSFPADAGHPVSGTVRDSKGNPLAGAMVTLRDPARRYTETVYSDAEGKFRLWTEQTGKLEVRVRHPLFKDFEVSGVRVGPKRLVSLDAQLMLYPTVAEFSESLPATAHAAAMSWTSPDLKAEFVSQCMFCHQIGNALTRRPRPLQVWQDTVHRMEGMGALLTWKGRAGIPINLVASFSGKVVSTKPDPHYDPALATARIEEWTMGEPLSFLHDVEAGANGKLYVVDMSYDKVLELDPATGSRREWAFPDSDLPLGGMFAGAINPVGTFGAKHGPHSGIEGPDGKFWMTSSLAGALTSFDPSNASFRHYPIPEPAVYPHTERFDRKGRLWFTLAVSNQVGRFDPVTEKFDLVRLPTDGWVSWVSARFSRRMLKFAAQFPRTNLHVVLSPHMLTGVGPRMLPLPYGIDIHPLDGSVWYGKLHAGKIGRIDPETLKVEEFATPKGGPRRLRFDPSSGILWIPSFTEGALMRFDTATREFKTYPLPARGPGELETPYAVGVHPVTRDVWITGGASDRLLRFDPRAEKFTAYPLPTRVTFMREVVFTRDGAVCSSYSNLPAHAIEGGRPRLVCLRPG
jgi:streptogramin lyase